MRKVFAAVLAVVVVWLGFRALAPSMGVALDGRGAPAVGGLSTRGSGDETPRPPVAMPPRIPVPKPTPRTAHALGDLVVRLTWQDDGAAATNVGVDATCRSDPAPRDAFLHAVSDARGIVALRGLSAGTVWLKTSLGHRFDAEVEPDGEHTIDVELERFDDVDGVVVAPDGTPVGGAAIWTSEGTGFWPRGHRVAWAGPDGRFHLRGLASETAFGARAAGYRPSLSFESGGLPVGPSGARTVTLKLGDPGGRLAGRVTGPDGRPLAGAVVQAGPRGGFIVDLPSGLRGEAPVPVPVPTGVDGTFACPNDLEPGAQPVHVSARGFAVWTGSVDIVAHEQAFLEAQLDRPARIVGRVVMPDGTPVAAARVIASREVGGGWYFDEFPAPRDTSRADGGFALDWVAPGEQELNASVDDNPRLGRARATATCVAGATTEVELVLELGRTIRGRVVDANGEPLDGWGVWGEPALAGRVYPRRDRTDEDGGFLLANLGDCAWEVRVAAPGEFPHPPRAKVSGVLPDTSGVKIVVTRAETSPATLRGRLGGADGRVPRDVRVTVWPADGDSGLFADVDPETGAFEHVSNLPGRYQVRVLRGGQTVASSEIVELFADRVTDIGLLQIGELARVEVTIRGVPDEQLGELSVVLEAESAATEVFDRDGATFRSRGVAAGTWIVRVRGGRWFAPDREIETTPGASTPVELDAQPGFEVRLALHFARSDWSTIIVEIRDPSGALLRRGGPWPRSRMTGDELTFPGLLLPAGRCNVEAHTDDGQNVFTTLDVGTSPQSRGPHRLDLR